MGVEKLLEQAKTRYSMDDVEQAKVKAVSVIAVEELSELIDKHLADQIASLKSKLSEAESRLASSDGGELERAAAEAAMEAEAAALEAKAAAELRAEQAEAKLKELQEQGAGGDDGASQELDELRAKVKALEAEKSALEAKAEKLEAKTQELEAKAKELEAASADDEEVTEEDHSRAARLARALLEDVVQDGGDDAEKAVAEGTFKQDFAAQIKTAKSTFNRRTPAAVRGERDHWEAAIEALKK
ncbi:MAG: hypothetical protein R3F62_04550 [Planctomycetota bacterium]